MTTIYYIDPETKERHAWTRRHKELLNAPRRKKKKKMEVT